MNQADIFWGKYCAGYVGVLIPVQSLRPCTWTDRGVSPKSCAKISTLSFFFFFFFLKHWPKYPTQIWPNLGCVMYLLEKYTFVCIQNICSEKLTDLLYSQSITYIM